MSRTFLFDLDETLYPRALGVLPRIDRRIEEYIRTRLGVADDRVDAIRHGFWTEHGTTLRGLMIHHRVDPDDYLAYVHDVELDDVLREDRELGRLLERLPGRKVVYTNASRGHADRVLGKLGIAAAFESIVSIETTGYVPKPDPAAYRTVLGALACAAGECVLIDDARRNLLPARALGMRTVWVSESEEADDVDHVIPTVHRLESVLVRR